MQEQCLLLKYKACLKKFRIDFPHWEIEYKLQSNQNTYNLKSVPNPKVLKND